MAKKDIVASAVIGFLAAFFLLILKLSGNIPQLSKIPYVESTLLLFPILSTAGIWSALLFSRKLPVLLQAAKFLLVGGLNTFLDLGILNVLVGITGISSGLWFPAFKGTSFAAAVLNSYLWNKYWTFSGKSNQTSTERGKEFLQFLLISAIGFFLNVGAASFAVNVIGPQFGILPKTWATVGALSGILIVFTWNFLGYKLIVFKR